MNIDDARTVSLLSLVEQACRDGEAGYFAASREASDLDLKYLFSSYSSQRGRFAGELRAMVEGDVLPASSSDEAERAVTRSWGRDREAVDIYRSSATILEDCMRVDEVVIGLYQRVLEVDHVDAIRAMLERQLGEVMAVHERLGELQALASL